MPVSRSPGDLTLRRAGAPDVPRIAQLINAAFAVERFFVDGDRIAAAEVEDYLAKGTFLTLDDAGGEPVACVYVELHGDRGYFGLLSVDPSCQRGGLGRRLIAAAEDLCRAAGCTAMDIKVVNLRTELPPIYRRLGYVETGTAPWPAEGTTRQPCHFVIMTKRLA